MGYFVEVLELRGFKVFQIDNTDEALGYIRNPQSDRPDVCIVDLMMPPGEEFSMEDTEWGLWTGVKLIDEISKQEHLSEVPVICLSNQPDQGEVLGRINSKVTFVGKYEITPRTFAEAILELLSFRSDS